MTSDEKMRKSADFCRNTCPICKHARRRGRGLLYHLVRLEGKLCPHCRDYRKVYGRPAHQ